LTVCIALERRLSIAGKGTADVAWVPRGRRRHGCPTRALRSVGQAL